MWGLLTILTDREIGYAALGMGALCGYAVVFCTKGRKGLPLQVIAAAASVAGILVGKYITFWHFFNKALAEEYGKDASAGLFDLDTVSVFFQNIGDTLGGFDILWVILAVGVAWRIPKATEIVVKRKTRARITKPAAPAPPAESGASG